MESELNQEGNHLKIPQSIDNPLDNVLYKFSDYMNPYFYKLNMTPNMITTLSSLFTLFATAAIIYNKPSLFVVLYLIAYFFDVADGSYARKYKMTSKFGDLYDHVKDIIGFCLICYIVFVRYRKSISPVVSAILGVFMILFFTHMGCEQRYLNDNTSTLNLAKYLCPCHEKQDIIGIMRWSRYFGPGSFTVFFTFFVYWIMKIGN